MSVGEQASADEQFRLLVDSVTEYAIYMLGPNGAVRTWNEGARRIKGYNDDEIIGRHFSVFFVNDDVTAGHPQRLLANATADGQATDEGWRVRKDGSRFWANVVITALLDEDGQVRGFAKVTRDDTTRRVTDELERRLELVADQERIAHDLNDAVIGRIFGAGLALQSCTKLIDDPQVRQHLDGAIAELDRAIDDIRHIVLGFPSTSTSLGAGR